MWFFSMLISAAPYDECNLSVGHLKTKDKLTNNRHPTTSSYMFIDWNRTNEMRAEWNMSDFRWYQRSTAEVRRLYLTYTQHLWRQCKLLYDEIFRFHMIIRFIVFSVDTTFGQQLASSLSQVVFYYITMWFIYSKDHETQIHLCNRSGRLVHSLDTV